MEHFGTHDQTELKEFGGFVKNLKSGSYELLFRTTISPLLAKNRAIEIARRLSEMYETEGCAHDTDNVIVKERSIHLTYGEWEQHAEEET